MKKLLHCCLAHPCWSGISGICAIITFMAGLKWSEHSKASDLPQPVADVSGTAEPKPNPPASVLNLTGKWEIESELTNSTYKAFKGLSLFYSIGLVQTGDDILVNGEKDSERKDDGVRIIYEGHARTRFHGEGIIKSQNGLQTLKLKIKEGSTTRGEISSQCNLEVINENLMKGTFSTQAASAIGNCTWRRVSPTATTSN
jgi:hypothetical protein